MENSSLLCRWSHTSFELAVLPRPRGWRSKTKHDAPRIYRLPQTTHETFLRPRIGELQGVCLSPLFPFSLCSPRGDFKPHSHCQSNQRGATTTVQTMLRDVLIRTAELHPFMCCIHCDVVPNRDYFHSDVKRPQTSLVAAVQTKLSSGNAIGLCYCEKKVCECVW